MRLTFFGARLSSGSLARFLSSLSRLSTYTTLSRAAAGARRAPAAAPAPSSGRVASKCRRHWSDTTHSPRSLTRGTQQQRDGGTTAERSGVATCLRCVCRVGAAIRYVPRDTVLRDVWLLLPRLPYPQLPRTRVQHHNTKPTHVRSCHCHQKRAWVWGGLPGALISFSFPAVASFDILIAFASSSSASLSTGAGALAPVMLALIAAAASSRLSSAIARQQCASQLQRSRRYGECVAVRHRSIDHGRCSAEACAQNRDGGSWRGPLLPVWSLIPAGLPGTSGDGQQPCAPHSILLSNKGRRQTGAHATTRASQLPCRRG